jgi:hypothetical protein
MLCLNSFLEPRTAGYVIRGMKKLEEYTESLRRPKTGILEVEPEGRIGPREICTHEKDWQEVDLYRERYKTPVRGYER